MSGPVQIQSDLDLSKTTFLVADSKSLFRDMVQSALLSAGAKSVKHATTVEKAIEVLNRYGQEINCVICDWDMAPVSGLELLRMIRTKGLAKTSPRTAVIILTARADAAAVRAAMALDVNGFAVAPLSFDKLVKTVANSLTRTWILHQPSQYAAVALPEATSVVENKPSPSPSVTRHVEPSAARPVPHMSAATHTQAKRNDELKNVHMCPLTEVHAGDVLARDLRDRDGHLLLSAGAVLKPTLIERLKDVAGGHADSYHLWVGEKEAVS